MINTKVVICLCCECFLIFLYMNECVLHIIFFNGQLFAAVLGESEICGNFVTSNNVKKQRTCQILICYVLLSVINPVA